MENCISFPCDSEVFACVRAVNAAETNQLLKLSNAAISRGTTTNQLAAPSMYMPRAVPISTKLLAELSSIVHFRDITRAPRFC